MKAFTFQAPPNILFEPGASRKIAEIVGSYSVRRVLLVTDKGVRDAGLTKGAEAALEEGGLELSVFDAVEADPPSHELGVLDDDADALDDQVQHRPHRHHR